MWDEIFKLFNSGLKVFSEERRRHFAGKLEELQAKVDEENAKRFPHYNRDRLYKAMQERNRFMASFQKEFDMELTKKLLQLGDSNDV